MASNNFRRVFSRPISKTSLYYLFEEFFFINNPVFDIISQQAEYQAWIYPVVADQTQEEQ